MKNPWNEISLLDYESHMKLESVNQLQTMNVMMRDQIYRYPVSSLMIFGIAGGNGLDHIDPGRIRKVYGVDINKSYLDICSRRYENLANIFQPIEADLTDPHITLPEAELVIANLFVEYIGYDCFSGAIKKIRPRYVSCIIQVNDGGGFVSDSPYTKVFDRLAEIHFEINETELTEALSKAEYYPVYKAEAKLPNGKKFIRLDFGGNHCKEF